MRYYIFLSLASAVLILDAFLFALTVLYPLEPRYATAHSALAAPQPTLQPTRRPTSSSIPATSTSPPTMAPSPTTTPTATATPEPPTATATPEPRPRLIAEHTASFTPGDRAMRTNINMALSHYQSALMHSFVAPGSTFSFNAALGAVPQRLPWKYVTLKSTATPGSDDAPSPEEIRRIQGGGLCDLASRYVMAARPLLPSRAFRFVNHLRSNGIRLRGVPNSDAVAIWAVGGQPGEQDLRITNVTDGWLEFVVERDGDRITVRARLWDRLPPA
ncbi:MAG: hypothetical protein ACJ8CR_28715 [Roseiflexaceae bacterium]